MFAAALQSRVVCWHTNYNRIQFVKFREIGRDPELVTLHGVEDSEIGNVPEATYTGERMK